MWFRILFFLSFQLAGAALGWFLADERGALACVLLAGVLWLAIDVLRGLRVIRWLRGGATGDAPQLRGLWGESADRMRRLLKQSAQQTLAGEQRLQEFLAGIQASPNGVVLLDKDGRIEWCNQMAAEHFGFDPQRDVQQLIGNLVREPAFAAALVQPGAARGIQMPGRNSSLSRPVRLAVHLYPYGEGRRLLLSNDVTALEQAEAMRRDFVANVSHEIRTPLTVLSGFVETLQTLPLDEPERARYLDHMAQQAERMQSLVHDLLTLSRIEGSPLPGASVWIPLPKLMGECRHDAEALSALLTAGHASPHVLRFGTMPAVEIAGISSELLSAVSNLVSNAIRYTPAGGQIDVEWRSLHDGRAEFSVQDTGPGIAAEHLPRLTERFYRVDTSRSRETGGTGLGLAIVKHVAQRHGAELRIESRLGRGSRFAIIFPASRLRPLGVAATGAQLPA